MADEEPETKEYRWETGYEKTWLVLIYYHFYYITMNFATSYKYIPQNKYGLIDGFH